jgi:HSP20 family molecular chaperone IbpA
MFKREMLMSKKQRKNTELGSLDDYLEELNILTDKLMSYATSEGPSWNTETCCLQALSNIFITPREVIVTADLPYIEPETIKVESINENVIEITAKMKKKVQFADLGICHRQGEFLFLRCQGRIDVEVDTEKMKISCENGILELRLPRKKIHEFQSE